ncbi:hypothetical protein Droror1_Dr00014781 [Drosera rotundifolia]
MFYFCLFLFGVEYQDKPLRLLTFVLKISICVAIYIAYFKSAASVPNLAMVHGVDNKKLANHLDRAIFKYGKKASEGVSPSEQQWRNLYVIARTKSGVDPSDCVALTKHVKMGCPKNLEFCGLMTIGMPDYT